MKEKRVAPKVQAVGRGLGHSHNRPDTARIRRMARNGFRSRRGAQPMKHGLPQDRAARLVWVRPCRSMCRRRKCRKHNCGADVLLCPRPRTVYRRLPLYLWTDLATDRPHVSEWVP